MNLVRRASPPQFWQPGTRSIASWGAFSLGILGLLIFGLLVPGSRAAFADAPGTSGAPGTPAPETLLAPSIPAGHPAPAEGPTVSILVKYRAAAKTADMDSIEQANSGRRVAAYDQIRTHVIEVPRAQRDQVLQALQHQGAVERAEPAVIVQAAGTPNDPAYPQQWALPRIAWDQAYGTIDIAGTATLAVLDTGVDAAHPDLAGRMVAGASFTGGDPNSDPNGHGTALAGIAAANVNDATGMAGVAYAGVTVMPVQVLGADGMGTDADVVAGLLYAADHGARVALMGFSSPDYSASLADAVAYAEAQGMVLVAATGNDGSTAPTYPAGMPGVLGVAATDENDALAANSNTGSALIAAPGVSIYAPQPGGGYTTMSGTSSAAAHVAGLAALLVANGDTAVQAADQLRGAADPMAGQPYGRINVAAALGAPVTPPATPTVGPQPTPGPTPTYVVGASYKVALSPSSLIFAGQAVGTTSAAQNVTLTNDGNGAQSVTISFTGSNPGDFVETDNCSGTLAANATCTIHVTFKPSAVGSRSATLHVAGNLGGTANTTLTGTATKGTTSLTVSPITGTYGGYVSLSATLQNASASGVSNKTISFTVNGTSVGSATTNSSGVATLNNVSLGSIAFGTYATGVGASFAGDSDYSASSNSASLTVNKATPTITWINPADIVYGAAIGSTQLNASAGAVAGSFTYNPPSGTVLNAGDHQALQAIFTPNDTTNYNTASATVYINVAKATPVITWDTPADITYGMALGDEQLNASAVPDGGTLAYSPEVGTVLNAGDRTLSVIYTPAAGDQGNYTNATKSVTIHVNKATPTITWATPGAITYGTALSSAQLNASAGAVAGSFTYNPPSGTVLNAGDHQALQAIFTPNDTTNYNTASATVYINVAKATPTITWSDPVDITYGTALGATQLNASAGAVAGSFTYSPAAGAVLSAGDHQALQASFTPNDTTNYNTASATVNINVNKATPTITWGDPADITYGTALSGAQLNASAGAVAGSFTYNPAAGTVLNAGIHQPLQASFTPDDAANYNTAPATVYINVNKATPVITWATPADVTYGTALGAEQLNASAEPDGGTFEYSPAAGVVPGAGDQTLSVTYTPAEADQDNYGGATAAVTLHVSKATPVITWNPADIGTYGTPLGGAQLNATASVGGSFTYDPDAGAVLLPGSQELSVTFTPTDAANYNSTSATRTINVGGAIFQATLQPGWNLVSYNLIPLSTNVAALFAGLGDQFDLVYAWDASTQSWHKYDWRAPAYANDLTTLDLTQGFWINITDSTAVEWSVPGNLPASSTAHLYTGWNLVGYPAGDARVLPDAVVLNVGEPSLVYAYHAAEPGSPWQLYDWAHGALGLSSLTPGYGYWMMVGSDADWMVSYAP